MTTATLPRRDELPNAAMRAFVVEWAEVTTPERIEVIGPHDEARLIAQALERGELFPAGEGRYYARSHPLDTARSEERTVVATENPADAGVFNNWRPGETTVAEQCERMRGAMAGKTMYVVPYLMAVPGTGVAHHGAGIELTDDRLVVLQMMRMARVGMHHLDGFNPTYFVRGVHVTGKLDALGQGTQHDRRLFATVADRRLILHYGSAYGGNALLGKIAHSLRQAAYDARQAGDFLAEQFMLLGVRDKQTGATYHFAGGFPSASGKTNLAMTLPPDALGDRYEVQFYGDDIAWMWRGEDGYLYGMNPENGVFGVAGDTNETTNPAAMAAMAPGSGTIFTNVARNDHTGEVWWEGKTSTPPQDVTGWRDWRGRLISERGDDEREEPWAHPNSRFTSALRNVPNLAPDAESPAGVRIDAIIFGGRTRDREPLVRALDSVADGVYDGLTLGAEATFAAEGVAGQLRYDPMSMRPFMSYPEGEYAAHWLRVLDGLEHPPLFAHVNWFQRDPDDGHYLWPGYRENLRVLLWLIDYRAGRASGTRTPVGTVPRVEELNLDGLELAAGDLERLLHIDLGRWCQEAAHRGEYLAQFRGLPERIREAHERLTHALREG